MELIYTQEAKADLKWWRLHGDEATKRKITKLLPEIAEHPTTGTGKPELLKGDLAGYWSRRINQKDRIVYRIEDNNDPPQ